MKPVYQPLEFEGDCLGPDPVTWGLKDDIVEPVPPSNSDLAVSGRIRPSRIVRQTAVFLRIRSRSVLARIGSYRSVRDLFVTISAGPLIAIGIWRPPPPLCKRDHLRFDMHGVALFR